MHALVMQVNRAGLKLESNQTYLNMLMYTLERADRMCADRARGANGTFVVVIDLEGFSLTGGLPFSVIKVCAGRERLGWPPGGVLTLCACLLPCLCTQEFFAHTAHYPFRINGIYLINSNASFNFLWGLMKGMLPKRIDKQVHFYRACWCGCVFHVSLTLFRCPCLAADLHARTCHGLQDHLRTLGASTRGSTVRRVQRRGPGERPRVPAGLVLGTAGRTGSREAAGFPAAPVAAAVIPFDVA
jgi:hypothetical protein